VVEEGNALLVDRRSIEKILDEVRLGISDLADETQSLEIGRQLGATSLLRTIVSPWTAEQIRAVSKLIDTETTKIMAASCCNIPLPEHLRARCALSISAHEDQEDIVEAENPGSEYRTNVWTDKALYKIGEDVTVSVRCNQAGYLYLFDIDSQGNKTLLYPNVFSPKHLYVRPGETFVSPKGWFVAGSPTGRGYIKAVVTPFPMASISTDFSDLTPGNSFRLLTDSVARGVTINAVEIDGGFGTWWLTITE
jgi:hypothetical protein